MRHPLRFNLLHGAVTKTRAERRHLLALGCPNVPAETAHSILDQAAALRQAGDDYGCSATVEKLVDLELAARNGHG